MKFLHLAQAANTDAAAATGAAIDGSKNVVANTYGNSLDAVHGIGNWPVISSIAEILGPFAKYVGAIVIFLLAWLIICPLIRSVINRALEKTSWDEKLAPASASSSTTSSCCSSSSSRSTSPASKP
jgi:hypothetical protein